MHATRNRGSKYMKQRLTKLNVKNNKSIIIVEDFNTHFLVIDGTSTPKQLKNT